MSVSDWLYSVALLFYLQALPIRLIVYSLVANSLVLLYKYLRG